MRKIVAILHLSKSHKQINSFHGDLQTEHAFEIHMMPIR